MDYKNLKDKLLTNKFKHIIAADIASDVIRIAVVNCSKRINTVEKLISKQLPQELAADAYVFNKEKLAAFINEILKEENISNGVLVFTAGADKTALQKKISVTACLFLLLVQIKQRCLTYSCLI